jgi:CHAD domain-containing protein
MNNSITRDPDLEAIEQFRFAARRLRTIEVVMVQTASNNTGPSRPRGGSACLKRLAA